MRILFGAVPQATPATHPTSVNPSPFHTWRVDNRFLGDLSAARRRRDYVNVVTEPSGISAAPLQAKQQRPPPPRPLTKQTSKSTARASVSPRRGGPRKRRFGAVDLEQDRRHRRFNARQASLPGGAEVIDHGVLTANPSTRKRAALPLSRASRHPQPWSRDSRIGRRVAVSL